ncbi:MAG: hypothetical protein DBY25_04020 [Clostridiales bacterium]|nr:MAG: hypothetical protein DBY25_04020 [Clostridiales bacterium]
MAQNELGKRRAIVYGLYLLLRHYMHPFYRALFYCMPRSLRCSNPAKLCRKRLTLQRCWTSVRLEGSLLEQPFLCKVIRC